MAADNKIVTFVVDVVGDTTGEKFKGQFRTRNRLSHKEQLAKDEYRRRLLGADPVGASERAQTQAAVFAEINAHLTEAAKFWTDTDGGLELEDESVVMAVYEEVAKAIIAYKNNLKKATETTKADLQKKLDASPEATAE